jgi:predicted ABC-type ATPase
LNLREILARRPIVVALAGPNGAGKSSFYNAYLRPSRLRFVNADIISRDLNLDAYRAAEMADHIRRMLIEQRESFIFETVLSDPVGEKVDFLKRAESQGYSVVLFFIGIDSPQTSEERVAMRVSKGGHGVPTEKLAERYPRILRNLERALRELSNVLVYDNSDLERPYRLVAARRDANPAEVLEPVPAWLRPLLP